VGTIFINRPSGPYIEAHLLLGLCHSPNMFLVNLKSDFGEEHGYRQGHLWRCSLRELLHSRYYFALVFKLSIFGMSNISAYNMKVWIMVCALNKE
jgi:hypothetical protein